ncbi:hypothetical protein [Piscibacillus salipiscarius]|uniref:Voltage-dependent anion channel n=1 Tax=Piscibacillus salipiscarius TaxID=299480 RepID=A0ABW5QC13_9BACI
MLMRRIDPASGAIIMANGIFLYGGIQAFPYIDQYLGEVLAILLFIAWTGIYLRLTVQFFQKDFLLPFLNNPIQSFTIGTWIAGVSVLCNVLLKYFPETLLFLQVMSIINIALWAIFLVTMIKSFKTLLKEKNSSIHGVILLSTVGTQSIVILLENLFTWVPEIIFESLVLLGVLFYIVGVFLLARRYLTTKWTLIDDWKNTNCIIHGALSITGLAMVTGGLMTTGFMIWFWMSVFVLLVIVEVIEIIRAYKRIKKLGFIKGVWTYHISQWSRNFTFGMFFAFTLAMNLNSVYNFPEYFIHFQLILLPLWAKVVLLTLILEIWLSFYSITTSRKMSIY